MIGYHGTSLQVAMAVVQGHLDLEPSTNDYDWLGRGIYFWEGSRKRAEEWAFKVAPESPFVLGAIISLGHCLDLLEQECLDHVRATYASLLAKGMPLPVNRGKRRELDCVILNMAVSQPPAGQAIPFDSVRAAFLEGDPLAPDSGLHSASHVQLAVHNPNCIKGYFIPRMGDTRFQAV